MLKQFLKKIYAGFDTSNEIEPVMWREVLRIINEGTIEGLSQAAAPPKHDKMFYQELRHSNEVFSAFKVHTMGVEMAAKLFDTNGNLKSFEKWANDVSGITSHQVGSWLRTEYDTAVIRAHTAADWREFQRNKDILPNLRWMPTTSPTPESSHQRYWQARLTLPVDDPWWETHHPGDRWNCKCTLEATDDPVVRPADMEETTPQKGLENNPGKDGHIFNDTHPYFPESCSQCFMHKPSGFKGIMRFLFSNAKRGCYDCPYANGCIEEAEKHKQRKAALKQIRQEVSFLKEKTFVNKDFPHDVKISGTGIKEWINQPHAHYVEKNEALYNLEDLFNKAVYKNPTKDKKKREGVEYSHIFETEIAGEKSWIIVHEFSWGQYFIYSVTDSDKVLNKKNESP